MDRLFNNFTTRSQRDSNYASSQGVVLPMYKLPRAYSSPKSKPSKKIFVSEILHHGYRRIGSSVPRMRQAVRVFGIRCPSRRVTEWGPNSRPQYFLENNHRMRQQKLRLSDGSPYASRTRPSNTGCHEPGSTFHADGKIALRTRFDHALSDTPRADTRRDRRLVCTKPNVIQRKHVPKLLGLWPLNTSPGQFQLPWKVFSGVSENSGLTFHRPNLVAISLGK
jgi:hypothetical protein